MVDLPKAVRDANERANQLIKEYAQGREGTPAETPAPDAQPVETVSETPETAPPVTTEPAETATAAPVETPPATVVDDPNNDTWKQRFNTLQGKYSAEVPVLNQQVTYLMQQNQQLMQRLENIEASRTTTETKPEEKEPSTSTAPPTPSQDLLADPKIKYFQTEYQDIYESTVVLCGRMIREEMDKFERRIGDRLAAEEKRVLQSKKDQFYEALDKAYPEWEKVQASAEFSQFMRETDELSGIPRWQLLNDAYKKFDASRAIRFFDLFYGKVSPSATKTTVTPVTHPSGEKVANRIAPPRTTTATPTGGGNGNQISSAKAREEYQKLCDLKIRKKVSEADFKKEEARLMRIMRGP
jgi:hypothetical protein